MKKYNYLLLLSLLFVPVTVFASQGSDIPSAFGALLMEAFVSIHMSLFVLRPLSEIISPDNSKKTFWTLFAIRAGILIFFDFFVTPGIAIFDFVAVFIGAFILIPVSALIAKKKGNTVSSVPLTTRTPVVTQKTTEIHCGSCGGLLKVTDKFCQNCGAPFDDNVKVTLAESKEPVVVKPISYDPIFDKPEKELVQEFIKRELVKSGVDEKTKLIPEEALKRKNILNVIFGILLYIYIALIFFHFPLYTYVIGLIILIVFLFLTKNFDLMDYLTKEVKSRPSEKISNIIMSTKNSLVNDTTRISKLIISIVAIGLGLLTFINPVILYEKMDGGYGVRYYAFGLTNYKTVTIPDSHKGEPVISIRGNGFSNMPYLEEAILPDSIKEIRGQAFLNDIKLTKVKLPSNLVTLGGGAFANCTSLETIVLPESLTEIGGESFMNAISLKNIVLPPNLKEIRGDTFTNCTSLVTINIPDTVTRIGGHAFEGCTSLKSVNINFESQLKEIGSSAFRDCDSLYSITIPDDTSVNSRAFKGSPTDVFYFGNSSTEVDYTGYVVQEGDTVLSFSLNSTEMVLDNDNNYKYVEFIDYDLDDNRRFNFIYNDTEDFLIDNKTNMSYTTSDGLKFTYISSRKNYNGTLSDVKLLVERQ